MTGLGEGRVLAVVGCLEFGGRDVPALFVKPPVVEPVGFIGAGSSAVPAGLSLSALPALADGG